jgi:EAL domain-containing protein (putative c-di-GMP-specific phosphodiesterase class I)
LANTRQNAAARPPSEVSGETAATLGARLVALLPALRFHSLSLFDTKGNVQWLSEGALGPDEQSTVAEAIATLTAGKTRAHLDVPLPGNQAALFLAVRTPDARLAGVVMILMDAATLRSGNLAARVLTTNMRGALQKVALFLSPPPEAAAAASAEVLALPIGAQPLAVAVLPYSSSEDTAYAAVRDLLDWEPSQTEDTRALDILEPRSDAAADDLDVALVSPLTAPLPQSTSALPEVLVATPLVPAAGAAILSVEPALQVRELARLRPGGRTRRFQIVPVAEEQRGDALATLQQLLEWLRRNPAVLEGDPLNFTICVAAAALADPKLPGALGQALARAQLAPGTIGFEVRESACLSHRSGVEKLIASCEQSRCFVVIDDFTFNTGVLELLRSSAVRMLKVENRLSATAMRDKLAQARVVAIAQAAKVLGMHCAAKYVDSQSGRNWLAGAGFDLVQSSLVEPMQRLLQD